MNLFVKLFFLLLALLSSSTYAKSSDQNAPLHIEADTVEMREREGTSTYTGNVKITRGSLKITGDRIFIQNKDGVLHLIKINGKPATFYQLNDLGEEISAESKKMEYQADSGMLDLKEQALLIKNLNRFSSQHIIYDTQKDIVKAGHDSSTSSPEQPPRVKITIKPKSSTTQTPSPGDDKP